MKHIRRKITVSVLGTMLFVFAVLLATVNIFIPEYPIRTFIKTQVAPIRNTVIKVIRHCKDSFFTTSLPP